MRPLLQGTVFAHIPLSTIDYVPVNLWILFMADVEMIGMETSENKQTTCGFTECPLRSVMLTLQMSVIGNNQ